MEEAGWAARKWFLSVVIEHLLTRAEGSPGV